jgi:hypothetical protein
MKIESDTLAAEAEQHAKAKPQHIEVAIVTTSGSLPAEGFDTVPINQPIKVLLDRAAKKLGITDTTNWVAKVGSKELRPQSSYEDEGLSGQVEIDYGPREGGGGNE